MKNNAFKRYATILSAVLGSFVAAGQEGGHNLPLVFEPNVGQADPAARFLARASGYQIFFTDDDVTLALPSRVGEQNQAVDLVRIKLQGARKLKFEAEDRLASVSNYLRGQDPAGWRTGVPHYSKVRALSAYEGVDVVFYGKQRRIEYDFIVRPGADPSQIRLAFEGIKSKAIDAESGDLLLTTESGTMRQRKPSVYQQDAKGRRQIIESRYKIAENGAIQVDLPGYDRTRALVIDPEIEFSTFFGGSQLDGFVRPQELLGSEIANSRMGLSVDSLNRPVISGASNSVDLPLRNPLQRRPIGSLDCFIARFAPDGRSLDFATFIGGQSLEIAESVGIDSQNRIVASGYTGSEDFPLVKPFQRALAGAYDVFVLRLSSDGRALDYSTYVGGTNNDTARRMIVDSSDRPWVVGSTRSSSFPTKNPLVGGYNGSRWNGGSDGFVMRLSADGTAIDYSTLIGGSLDDGFQAIALDSQGRIYLGGFANSDNFPVRESVQGVFTGNRKVNNFIDFDGIVMRLSADGLRIEYSSYLGGFGFDMVFAVVVDSQNRLFAAGGTSNGGGGNFNFPRTDGQQLNGNNDIFVSRISSDGRELERSVLFGGNESEWAYAMALDSRGRVWLAGWTDSPNGFPTNGALTGAANYNGGRFGGQRDGYLMRLSPDLRVEFSSYLGGSDDDFATSLQIDPRGRILVTGTTRSPSFPTVNPVQPRIADQQPTDDAFLMRIVDETIGVGTGNLRTSTPELRFSSQVSIPTPQQQRFSITSDGPVYDVRSTVTTVNGGPWLTVSPSQGSTPLELTVTANPASLSPGIYRGNITLSATGAINSPVQVGVVLEVTSSAVPSLVSSVPLISLELQAANATDRQPRQFTIRVNSSNNAAIDISDILAEGGPWLTTSPVTRRTPVDIPVTINPGALAPDVYRGSIAVFANGVSNSPLRIPITVSFAGTQIDRLRAAPSELSFNLQSGSDPSELQTITVSNSGSTRPVSFSTVSDAPWLRITGTATTPATLQLRADPSGLAPGSYRQTVTFIAAGADPVTVPVTLTITPRPAGQLQVSASSLTFNWRRGDSAPPPQSFTITNSPGTATFNVSKDGAWFAVATDRTTTPATARVISNPGTLEAGVYEGSITVTPTSGQPVLVPVRLVVTSPSLDVSPLLVAFEIEAGASDPAPRTLTVRSDLQAMAFSATASSVGGWLAASPTRGSAPGTISIQAFPTGLGAGRFTGTVTIRSEVAPQPVLVNVTLTVNPPPRPQGELQVTPSLLTSSFQIGSAPPAATQVRVSSTEGTIPFSASAQVSEGDPAWLAVTPAAGSASSAGAPTVLSVSINPAGLTTPGIRDGQIVVANGTQDRKVVPVRLTVTAAPELPRLSTDTTDLKVLAADPTQPVVTQFVVKNSANTAATFTVTVRTDDGGAWLRALPDNALAGLNQPQPVKVEVISSGLQPGTYTGAVIVDGPSRFEVPVVAVVPQLKQKLILSQTAMTFFVSANSTGTWPDQLADILTDGSTPIAWTARNAGGASWLRLNSTSGQAGRTASSGSVLRLGVQPNGLPIGKYTETVEVDSASASNRNQVITITLEVVPKNPVLVSPAGLTFVANQGQPATPGTSSVQVAFAEGGSKFTLTPYLKPESASNNTNWLLPSVSIGNFSSSAGSGSFNVVVNSAGLAPGEYRAGLTLSTTSGQRNVDILLVVVAPGASNALVSGKNSPSAADCVSTRMIPLFTSLESIIFSPTGRAQPTEVVVVDNCGRLVNDAASLGAVSSNGDQPFNLTPLGDGRWAATWVPKQSDAAIDMNLYVADGSSRSNPSPRVTLYSTGTSTGPTIRSRNPVVSLDQRPLLALAPGTWFRLRGSALALDSREDASLPTRLGGAEVRLGGRALKLRSVSAVEILAVVPDDIEVNTSQQLVVRSGDQWSTPETVLISSSFPVAVAVESQPGTIRVEVAGLGKAASQKEPAGVELFGQPLHVRSWKADTSRPGMWIAVAELPPGSPAFIESKDIRVRPAGTRQ
jgi:hypothetical protein